MISPFAGRRLPSRPTAEAGPVCSSARLPRAPRSAQPSAAGRVLTTPGRDRRVAAMRRRRSPCGSHGLRPHPRARLHLPKPLRSPLHSPALPRCSARTRSALSPASATAAPPVEFTVGAPPRPAIKRTQLRLTLRHLVLAVVTPLSQGRAFFALRRRQPWRRRARPPWNASFFPSSTLPSCLLAFATSLRTPCARPLALTRPAMAAGPLVEPRHRDVSASA